MWHRLTKTGLLFYSGAPTASFTCCLNTGVSEIVRRPGFGTFFERYQTQIPTKPATGKYVFIAYGVNDCGFNFDDYTTSLFSTQLQTIITYANSQGCVNSDMVVLSGYFQNDRSWTNPYGGIVLASAANMSRYDSFITAARTVAQNNTGVNFVNPFDTYDATYYLTTSIQMMPGMLQSRVS